MGQYERHVFVCTSGETCPVQGDTEGFVKALRAGVQKAGMKDAVRVNKAGCFSQCGHGPMVVVYPENVWYAGVQAADLDEIVTSHIVGGTPVERLRYAPGKPGANKIDVAPAPPAAAAPAPAASSAWKRACRADEVPANGMKQVTVDGTDVLLIHAGDGVFACQAMCPHEMVPLEQGVHDGAALTCLEHLWQFDIRTGAAMGDAECGLKTYPVKDEGGTLYVEVGRG
jgi:nitrite reductase/ring-hydroxylating ferredoxin subunit/(2Fe-2S) ferredoxin